MVPYPFTPIVAGKSLSKKNLNKIAKALINMTHNNEGKKILSEFYLDGFVVKKPEFYQPISNMLKAVELKSGN